MHTAICTLDCLNRDLLFRLLTLYFSTVSRENCILDDFQAYSMNFDDFSLTSAFRDLMWWTLSQESYYQQRTLSEHYACPANTQYNNSKVWHRTEAQINE